MLRQAIITGVRNPTHLVHISSYLRTLLDDRCERLVVRWVGGGRTFGRIAFDPRAVARLLPDDPRIELDLEPGVGRWRFGSDHWATYLAVGSPGLKAYAGILAANPGRTPHVVITDEGLASYGTNGDFQDDWSRGRRPGSRGSVSGAVRDLGRRAIPGDRWALYRQSDDGWQVEEAVAAEFRRHVGQVPMVESDRVVILTQPWVTVGALSPDVYLHHIRRLAEVVRSEGKRVVVRPHPAEDPQLYADLEVVEAYGPAELDPSVVSAAEVIGEPSTALLNLAALYGRRARLVNPPLMAAGPVVLSTAQAALVRTFVDELDLTPQRPIGQVG